MKIGSHVGNSGDGMLLNSVNEALSYDANAFMVYLGPPQSTMRKDASRLNIEAMKAKMKENNLSKTPDVKNVGGFFAKYLSILAFMRK